jgi:transcriptional regulator with XRE-family HTH domain
MVTTGGKGGSMSDTNPIGERIRALREAHGMTQGQFGEIIGLDETAISKIENGRRGLAATELASICDHFGMRSDELLFGDGERAQAGALLRAVEGVDAQRAVARAEDALADFRYVKALIES